MFHHYRTHSKPLSNLYRGLHQTPVVFDVSPLLYIYHDVTYNELIN